MKSFNLEIEGSKQIFNITNKSPDKKLLAFICSASFHALCLLMIFYIALDKSSSDDFEIPNYNEFNKILTKDDSKNHKRIEKKELQKKDNPIINKDSSDIIQKQESNPSETSTTTNNQSEVTSSLNSEYVNLIAYKLNKYKSRFSMANAPNKSGTVVFRVILDESGKIKSYKLLKSSNHDFFDKIAEKIITSASSFPAPPKEIVSLGLEFNVPIVFDTTA